MSELLKHPLLEEYQKLVWVAESYPLTLKGRTRSWLALKFEKSLQRLISAGESTAEVSFVLERLKLAWPKAEARKPVQKIKFPNEGSFRANDREVKK